MRASPWTSAGAKPCGLVYTARVEHLASLLPVWSIPVPPCAKPGLTNHYENNQKLASRCIIAAGLSSRLNGVVGIGSLWHCSC